MTMTELRELRYGYWHVRVGAHEWLADSDGWVREHRWIKWNDLGRPSYSNCCHCEIVLPWRASAEEKLGSAYAQHIICVDHIDGNRDNNEVNNLRPICFHCNRGRALAGDQLWSEVAHFCHMATVHPSERAEPADCVAMYHLHAAAVELVDMVACAASRGGVSGANVSSREALAAMDLVQDEIRAFAWPKLR